MADVSKLNGYDIKDKALRDLLEDNNVISVVTLFSGNARSYYYEGQEINLSSPISDYDYLVVHFDSYNYNPADDDDPDNTKQAVIITPKDISNGTSFGVNETFMDSEYGYLNTNTMTLLVADNTYTKLRIVESLKGVINMTSGAPTVLEWTQANGNNTYAFGICLRKIKGVKLKAVGFNPIQ